MVFRWKITRPPFHQVSGSTVEVMHPGIEVEFETGSIAEAHGIYQDSGSALGEMFGADVLKSAIETATRIEAPGSNALPEGQAAAVTRRTRGPNKPKVDAVAPDPIVIPGAEVPPIAPVVPPPPPVPPAAAPPTGILVGKIAAELEKRATGSADGAQALADWLATSGITVKGATYAEAVTVLRLQPDEKLGPIAQALGVA